MPRTHTLMPLAVLLLSALAACGSSPVRSEGQWAENVERGQVYSRVLVLAVSPDVNRRCAFERALADDLRSATVVATSSCEVLGIKDPLTRENVERGVALMKADAVLAARLVAGKLHMEEGGTSDTQGSSMYKATGAGWGYGYGYWGAYGVPVVYAEFQASPSLLSMKGDVEIRSDLFETRGAGLVYTVKTQATDLESRDQALFDIIPAIAARLAEAGLLGP